MDRSRPRVAAALENRVVGSHSDEIELFDELFKNAELTPQFRPASARCARRQRHRCSVWAFGGKRKIQMIVNTTSGQDELPAFRAILAVAAVRAARFIEGEDFAEMIIQPHEVWFPGVKVEDGNMRVKVGYGNGRRRETLSDEMLVWE